MRTGATTGAISLPLFEQPDPAFYRGTTAATRRTSASGARKGLEHRATKLARVRALWAKPLTIQDIAMITGFAIGSVCSLKKCLSEELIEVDTVEKFWPDGTVTSRRRWQIAKVAK